jgi:hypothetical protein
MKGNDKFWFFWEQNYNPITMWKNDEDLRPIVQHNRDRVHNKQIDI